LAPTFAFSGAQPYVFVVQVDVDELAQLAALIEQPVLEAGIAGVQRLDRRAEISRSTSTVV